MDSLSFLVAFALLSILLLDSFFMQARRGLKLKPPPIKHVDDMGLYLLLIYDMLLVSL